jgi:hypothetical protein
MCRLGGALLFALSACGLACGAQGQDAPMSAWPPPQPSPTPISTRNEVPATSTSLPADASAALGEIPEDAESLQLDGTTRGVCSQPCRGSATPELGQRLQWLAASTRRCYNRELSLNPKLAGRITVTVRISETGAVCASSIERFSDGLGDLAECVEEVFRSQKVLPAPRGGCVVATVPIVFTPRDTRDAAAIAD